DGRRGLDPAPGATGDLMRAVRGVVLAIVASVGLVSCTSDTGWPAPAMETGDVSAASTGADVPVDAPPTRHTGPQGRVGQFVTGCAYSHTAPDDPIVHAGFPGRSHLHDFFGNTSTDAHSTLDSLLEGETTCQMQLDT